MTSEPEPDPREIAEAITRNQPFGEPLEPQRPTTADFFTDPATGETSTIYIRWEMLDGRWEPIRFEVLNGFGRHWPITAELVRKIPLGTMIEQHRRHKVEEVVGRADPAHPVVAAVRQQWTAKKGVIVTDEVLQAVADCYRSARSKGFWPADAVADEFVISKSAANKRIRMARDKGFLEPPKPR